MMPLQLSSSVTTTTSSSSIRSHNYSVQRSLTTWSSIRRSESSPSPENGKLHCIGSRSRMMRRRAAAVVVKCSSSSLDTEEAEETVVVKVGQVTDVDKDTFWPIVKAAGDKTVVLDMYTQWCGPCKIIAPKYVELSEKYLDVVFLKLDCNQENKPLAKELGIRVVPTFKILKEGSVVKEVTGAKFDDLVVAIDTVRSSSS